MIETIFEGRRSDSPYVEMIWRGQAGTDYFAVCPADVCWNLLFLKHEDQVRVSVEGPLAEAKSKTQLEGTQFLVIKFKLGVFMPHLPVTPLVNDDVVLPEGASKTFWLHGSTWQLPDFENVENFVDRLVRHDLLVVDPIVHDALQDRPSDYSFRTVRRRFLHATGLTPKVIQQIERAKQAAQMLEQGVSILDAAYDLGYADQPHMTRSLRRYIGFTPTKIMREGNVLPVSG